MVRHGHSTSGEQIEMPVAAQAVAAAASSREITHAEAILIVQHQQNALGNTKLGTDFGTILEDNMTVAPQTVNTDNTTVVHGGGK